MSREYQIKMSRPEDTINDQSMTQTTVTVAVVNNFNYDPFVVPGPDGDPYKAWNEWFQGLEHILQASNTAEDRKFSTLLAYGGKELRQIYSTICNGTIPKIENFETAVQKLEQYFKPKQHATYLRVKFWELTKNENETIDEFVSKLNEKKRHCNFGTSKEEIEDFVMLDKFLMSMPTYIKQELIKDKKLNFDSAVQQAKELESSRTQARELSQSSRDKPFLGSVNKLQVRRFSNDDRHSSNKDKRAFGKGSIVCFRCNSKNHKSDYARCPAKDSKCFDCGNYGHFAGAVYCKKRKGSIRRCESEPNAKRRRINNIEDEEEEVVCNINSVGVNVVCEIEGLYVKMLVDSGTNRNIIDEKTYKMMIERGFDETENFKDCHIKFIGYGNTKLSLVTSFQAKIRARVNGKTYETFSKFFVIKNGSQPLLSKGKEICNLRAIFLIIYSIQRRPKI